MRGREEAQTAGEQEAVERLDGQIEALQSVLKPGGGAILEVARHGLHELSPIHGAQFVEIREISVSA